MRRHRWLGHVTVRKGGRARCLPMTQRLTSALKAHRHLRSPRVPCLSDGAPITRGRVIKAIRGAQGVAGLRQARVTSHILFASCDGGGTASRDSRTRRPCGRVDRSALHASKPGGNRGRDPIAGQAIRWPQCRKWRHCGDAIHSFHEVLSRSELMERATGIEPV
jgi:hypothetical protein